MVRFQYSEALIREELWSQLLAQILLVLLFVPLAVGIDSKIQGRRLALSAGAAGFSLAVTMPIFSWWTWRHRRESMESIVIDVGDEEIVCSSSDGSLFGTIREKSIRLADLSKVIEGPLGWTFFDSKSKNTVFLPRGVDRLNEIVDGFLRKLAPEVLKGEEGSGWAVLLSLLIFPFFISVLVSLLLGGSPSTPAISSAYAVSPAVSIVLQPYLRQFRAKCQSLGLWHRTAE